MRRILAIILYFAGLLIGALIFGLAYSAWAVPNFCPNFITYHLTSHPNREICRATLPTGEGWALLIYSFLLAFCTVKLFLPKGQMTRSVGWRSLRLITIFFLTTFGFLLIPWLAVGAPSVESLSLVGTPELSDFINIGVSSVFVTAPITVLALVMVSLISKIFSRRWSAG